MKQCLLNEVYYSFFVIFFLTVLHGTSGGTLVYLYDPVLECPVCLTIFNIVTEAGAI